MRLTSIVFLIFLFLTTGVDALTPTTTKQDTISLSVSAWACENEKHANTLFSLQDKEGKEFAEKVFQKFVTAEFCVDGEYITITGDNSTINELMQYWRNNGVIEVFDVDHTIFLFFIFPYE